MTSRAARGHIMGMALAMGDPNGHAPRRSQRRSGRVTLACRGRARSKAGRAGLQRALDGEELIADLLAVQVGDDKVRFADVGQLAEGVALRTAPVRLALQLLKSEGEA